MTDPFELSDLETCRLVLPKHGPVPCEASVPALPVMDLPLLGWVCVDSTIPGGPDFRVYHQPDTRHWGLYFDTTGLSATTGGLVVLRGDSETVSSWSANRTVGFVDLGMDSAWDVNVFFRAYEATYSSTTPALLDGNLTVHWTRTSAGLAPFEELRAQGKQYWFAPILESEGSKHPYVPLSTIFSGSDFTLAFNYRQFTGEMEPAVTRPNCVLPVGALAR